MSRLAFVVAAVLAAPLGSPTISLAEIQSGLDPAILRRDLAGVVADEMARRHLVGAVVVVPVASSVVADAGLGELAAEGVTATVERQTGE